MSYSDLIARRYLHSQRKEGFFSFIAAISVLGGMLGTATLIVALSVLGGFEQEITEKVVGFTSHVQIIGYQNLPLKDYRENANRIAALSPAVTSVAPYVSREALVRSRDGVDGILLKGVDPSIENAVAKKYMVAGTFDIDHPQGAGSKLVIGRNLSARLALSVGDRAVVFVIG